VTESDPWYAATVADRLPVGWRRHGRAAHLRLIADWGGAQGRWLKTDLFEEATPDRGLIPELSSATWTGIDVSPRVAATASSVVTAGAANADVMAIPFASASFDGVLSTSTLDHLPDREAIGAALRELRRVMRRGGRLVLTLDNPGNVMVRLRNALPASLQRRSGLVTFPLGATLGRRAGVDALTGSGFEAVDVAFVLHAPHVVGTRLARFPWWERKALPAFDRLGSTRLAPATGHFVAFLAVAR
jgi:SAM-dependent methyltransferase